jgi:hypothetical protein
MKAPRRFSSYQKAIKKPNQRSSNLQVLIASIQVAQIANEKRLQQLTLSTNYAAQKPT